MVVNLRHTEEQKTDIECGHRLSLFTCLTVYDSRNHRAFFSDGPEDERNRLIWLKKS